MSLVTPLHDIAHLGSVELFTPDLERSLWCFRDLLGMEAVHRSGGSVYLRATDDHAASTLKLTVAANAGVGCVAWRAASPEALERRAAAIIAEGIAIGWTDGDYGRGQSFRFCDPDGHLMELYCDEEGRWFSSALHSASRSGGHSLKVRRTDHLALLAADVERNRRFAEKAMGFQFRGQAISDQGASKGGAWICSDAVHHGLAYVADPKGCHGRFHHLSLWVYDQKIVERAAHILMANRIFVEVGPTTRDNSPGLHLYAYEPGGNRIEISSDPFPMLAPALEAREQPAGIHRGCPLPESFLQYATPHLDAAPARA